MVSFDHSIDAKTPLLARRAVAPRPPDRASRSAGPDVDPVDGVVGVAADVGQGPIRLRASRSVDRPTRDLMHARGEYALRLPRDARRTGRGQARTSGGLGKAGARSGSWGTGRLRESNWLPAPTGGLRGDDAPLRARSRSTRRTLEPTHDQAGRPAMTPGISAAVSAEWRLSAASRTRSAGGTRASAASNGSTATGPS
jgi:hypothetical protein